jgi:SAM-dependent methyltransferase
MSDRIMVERIVPGGPGWNEFSAHHLARYLFAAQQTQGCRVLDAGSGSGYGARILRTAVAASVTGVDLDPETVRLAAERFGGDGVDFRVGDCQGLDGLAGPFDLITNFENLEHLRQPARFLEATCRLLGPQGRLLVSTPDRAASPPFVAGRPRNEFHFHEWYRDEFEALLRKHFQEVEILVQVEANSLASRRAAVDALRQGLFWANPFAMLIWRKWPPGEKGRRKWKRLAGLAAPSPGDYPILPAATASLFGTTAFHLAVCRQPLAIGC